MKNALQSTTFWSWFLVTGIVCGLFFAWELGIWVTIIRSPPRPAPGTTELWFTAALILLLSLNTGLFSWRRKYGSCPAGTKKATRIGGTIGVVALLCPACLLLPYTIFGASISLWFLSPYVPLLQVIAIVLLVASARMLWSRH